MKKSLLALAVLGAFAGVASAQSSVTLYGTIDLSAKYVKNDNTNPALDKRRLSLSQDGINSSQLGFRGVEDLGGGLKASFVLLSGVNADTGTTNAKFFNRKAVVSVLGGFGEVRLGRDYTPTFWNNTIFDAFGTNGLGDSSHVAQLLTGTFVRADNSIGYFLPSNIGGLYGQFMVAASEGASTNQGRYVGGRVGFAAGPFDIAGAFGEQRLDLTAGQPQQKTFNIGGAYDFGAVKLLSYYDRDTLTFTGFDKKDDRISLSAVIPVGQGEIHVGGERSKLKDSIANTSNTVSQYALGYVYNLSKRTAFYSTVSRLKNGALSTNSVASGTAQLAAPTPNGKSTGFEVGLRHFF